MTTHTETQAMCERLMHDLTHILPPTQDTWRGLLTDAAALLTRQQEEIAERDAVIVAARALVDELPIDDNNVVYLFEGIGNKELADMIGALENLAALQATPDEGVNETFTLSDEAKL